MKIRRNVPRDHRNVFANVAADYLMGFRKTGPHVKGLRLWINSQHTGSAAESYFADLVFRNIAQL